MSYMEMTDGILQRNALRPEAELQNPGLVVRHRRQGTTGFLATFVRPLRKAVALNGTHSALHFTVCW